MADVWLVEGQLLTQYVEREEGESIPDRFQKMCKKVSSSYGWVWCTTDDLKFRACMAGLMLECKDRPEETRKIVKEMEGLKHLSMLLAGAPMDLERMLEDQQTNPPMGLQNIFREEFHL